MKLSVLNIKGKDTGRSVELSKSIFEVTPNDHAVYLDVKRFLANNRQGTNKTKERAEIAGSTRKIKKQKGTGTARAGSIKNPLFRGGGRVFGPRPRNYGFKVNKKVKRLARKSALTLKFNENNIIVVEDFNFDTPSTKLYSNALASFELLDNKSLLVLDKPNNNILLSSRNLRKAKVVLASQLNTYDIMNANKMLFIESSIKVVEETF